MHGKTPKFEVKLPVRIAGLVFWGLAFVGILLAMIVLQDAETKLLLQNKKDTLIISYEIEEIIELYSEAPVMENASDHIREKVIPYKIGRAWCSERW